MSREQGISIKAIALGTVADIVATLVFSIGFGVVAGIVLVAQGVQPNDIPARMQDSIILIPSLILGLLSTALGGFVAGWVAGRSEVLHGAVVGILGSLLGLLFIASVPLWYSIASLVIVIPIAILGGWLASAFKSKPRKHDTDSRPETDELNDEQW